ncbi:5-(carboxyamino)imidazole ribonucleotide synthase [Ramlibacter sp. RBP-2]|uniref:N5-carboxyaminoimidazole ribonucleotide synthase n=2 Tax=Ramlibacter lithotrophicus TaxID=2606681 RepID=A0A7X6DKV9_9BURK|nr:5-(carboxyamino)imidazole ribonucleotide synthase [Ramlibacter lithotrophicus]
MGGGQLGRMFVHAAQRLGYFTAVLDPDPASPAGLVSHYHVKTGYLDQDGLAQLLQRSAAITTEFENVPAPALATLGAHRPVAPGPDAVAIAQDRAQEKAHFIRCGVACAPHAVLESASDLERVPEHLLPGILKTSRLGYDGKGQLRVATRDELARAWDDLKKVPCVLEQLLPLAAECSVIVARSHDGAMVHLPAQWNLHRGGILAVTEAGTGALPEATAARAIEATRAIADGLRYVGVLCVEFFLLQDGSLVVNEMAPRPHNSGHYSMDACDVSQFELQVRTLAGLPLVQPRLHSPAIMLNLLGDLWFSGGAEAPPPWEQVLALPGVHLHLYGKLSARPGRKMGHLTVTGATTDAVRGIALQAARVLGIEPF